MVKNMKGIAVLTASFHLPVSPHISPKAEKRKPDKPIVGSFVNVGRKLASVAITRDSINLILPFICHKTSKLMVRWKQLA